METTRNDIGKAIHKLYALGALLLFALLALSPLLSCLAAGGGPSRAGDNTPPNAVITSPADGGTYPDSASILFDGSASNDPDGQSLTYMWMIMKFPPSPGPGMFPVIRSVPVFNVTLDPGDWMVLLEVNDSIDSDSTSILIKVVHNSPPTALIDSPKNGETFTTVEEITFDGAGSGDPDGDVLKYRWTSSVDGDLSRNMTFSGALSLGTHTISLTVEDIYQTTNHTEIEINIRLPNYPPNIFVISPNSSGPRASDGVFEIRWSVSDGNINDTATVDLFYNTEMNEGTNRVIEQGLQNTGSYLWDLSDVPGGKYYIYAVATDAEGKTGSSWSKGLVEVIHNFPPAGPSGFRLADEHALKPTLVWDASEDPNDDRVTYVVNVGTKYRLRDITDGAEVTSNTYRVPVRLRYNKTYYAEVTAFDRESSSETLETSFELVNNPPWPPTVSILPENPASKEELECSIEKISLDPDEDEVSYEYRWQVRLPGAEDFDEVPDLTGNVVPARYTNVGEFWKCTVRSGDGYAFADTATSSVRIRNIKPVAIISAPLAAGIYVTNSTEITLRAEDSYDEDGDELSYVWRTEEDGEIGVDEVTTLRFKNGIHHVVLTVSDGLDTDSARLTVIIEPPHLTISDVRLDPEQPMVGVNTFVLLSVKNLGGDMTDVPVQLSVDGKLADEGTVDIIPHGPDSIRRRLEWTPAAPGEVRLTVRAGENSTVRVVEVLPRDEDEPGTPAGDEGGNEEERGYAGAVSERPWLLLVAGLLVGLAVIFGLLAYKKKRLQERRRSPVHRSDGAAMHFKAPGFPSGAPDQLYLPPINRMPLFAPIAVPSSESGRGRGEVERIPPHSPPPRTEDVIQVDEELPSQEAVEAVEAEVVEDGGVVVECYKCGGDISVSSTRRPIVVTCPHCGTEGELDK